MKTEEANYNVEALDTVIRSLQKHKLDLPDVLAEQDLQQVLIDYLIRVKGTMLREVQILNARRERMIASGLARSKGIEPTGLAGRANWR